MLDEESLARMKEFVGKLLEKGVEVTRYEGESKGEFSLEDICDASGPFVFHDGEPHGKEVGLYYVFVGNVPGSLLPRGVEGESTYCHSCNAPLIRRWGYSIRQNRVKDGVCPDCGAAVSGIRLG